MMNKTTITHDELVELDVCVEGLEVFDKHHKLDSKVKFSEALNSNGPSDVWWLISEIYDQLSDNQKTDLRLLSCDYAERVLPIFEKQFPDNKAPREAIRISRLHAIGKASDIELSIAGAVAGSAVKDAARHYRSSRAAVWAARAAVWATAWVAVRDAEAAAEAFYWTSEIEWQNKQLIKLLLKWEKSDD